MTVYCLTIRSPTVISPAFPRPMIAWSLSRAQGVAGPPLRTLSTPSCLMRRGPADGSGAGAPGAASAPLRPPPPRPPPSPIPTAIFGVSFPSLVAAGIWAAARGPSAAGVHATAPKIFLAVLREKFMIGVYTNACGQTLCHNQEIHEAHYSVFTLHLDRFRPVHRWRDDFGDPHGHADCGRSRFLRDCGRRTRHHAAATCPGVSGCGHVRSLVVLHLA